ncbi:MAG TPA: HDIG domain-containing protein [Solirubrobacteraceae bacterium]|jgi:putative nucleotidyltransferase with HDIG domain|nr:HDIG domain-containing protein [Solirubrobacteraceae bacterium]
MSAPALEVARAALRGERCWIVGGAVRDELLGLQAGRDLDLVVDGRVEEAARAVARQEADAVAFSLSDEFGGWRVVSRSGDWQIDLNPLRGDSIDGDLALRDFTLNAIARPLGGGAAIDPLGGEADLHAGLLRLASSDALAADPLRALRLVRMVCEFGFDVEAQAAAAARAAAGDLERVAGERVYLELARVVASERASAGMRLLLDLGLGSSILPELEELRGVAQSRYHHLDALDHTLAVLDQVALLERDGAAVLGDEHVPALRELLAEPLADELPRATGLRFGALTHDIAKGRTRAVFEDGRVGFPGHDALGASMARGIFERMRAAERMRAHVAALTRNHLRLGFLVHEAPLGRGEIYAYLDACDPVGADVTLLSVADRLATLGDRAEEAIERHLELARAVIADALAWHRDGRPAPLIRGDVLARALGIEPGPPLGELLAAIAQEAYSGTLRTAGDAIAFARERLA